MTSGPITLDDALAARERLRPYLQPTPLRSYPVLDAATKSITTDPGLDSLRDLYDLARTMRAIPTEKVQFLTVPRRPYTYNANRDELVQPAASGELMRIEHGGGGEKTRLICGFLRCDQRLCGPMLESLPRLLRVPLGDGVGSAWLTSLLRAGTHESSAPRPGGETVLAKLSELLFVEALRRYIELLPGEQTGWLAGLRDRFVGRALALMHGDPGHDWTVEELAGRVGASRSSLAQRFSDLLGQAPMQYLTRWRLTIAAQRLRDERVNLARLAEDSGYESEAAFNRAFKRALGTTPGAWRKARLHRQDAKAAKDS